MLVAMDLNASPLPEEDEETFERHIEEYTAPEEHVETAVEISRREREERRRRLKRERPDDRSVNGPSVHDRPFQTRNHRSHDRNKLPPGWLDCPAFGQEINFIIPSKVPLGESFNDLVAPANGSNDLRRILATLLFIIPLVRKIELNPRSSEAFKKWKVLS
ncbi:hypothetical protein CK203_083572 [Vitis vinifera]|uniref:Uncharacterized protein n=1 Tax=Vitis vinifera TaxID=29760 RepID=A0A438BY98_VITVI|nr:hypothetical protein CK203_083572 [Vitis vinifera]